MTGRGAAGTAVDEGAYEADARRWLRAYPPRWRREREDEVLGVLLDTRPVGASRLTGLARLDLVRGAVGYRWRSRPPVVVWLLWRVNRTRVPARYLGWVRDDVEGRLFPLRYFWGSWAPLLVGGNVLLHLAGGARPWLLPVAVVALSVLAMLLVRDGTRDRVLSDAQDAERRMAHVQTGPVRWSRQRPWSYGRWLLLPVLSAWLGVGVLVAVVAARVAGGAVPPMAVPSPADLSLPGLVWVVGWSLWLVCVVGLSPRRVATRPEQPWRDEPRTPPRTVVAVLTLAAPALPLVLAAAPLQALADARADELGLVGVLARLLAWCGPALLVAGVVSTPVVLAALVAPLLHLRVGRALARRPGPPLALLDVLGLEGGRSVLRDPPEVPAAPVPWR